MKTLNNCIWSVSNRVRQKATSFFADDNQCDVKCDTVEGYSAAHSERHGIMPDGTPCTLSSLSSVVEKNNLPRKSGLHGSCVQGHCYVSVFFNFEIN